MNTPGARPRPLRRRIYARSASSSSNQFKYVHPTFFAAIVAAPAPCYSRNTASLFFPARSAMRPRKCWEVSVQGGIC